MFKLVLVVLALIAAASAQYLASPYYGGYYRSGAVGAVGAYPYAYGAYASPYTAGYASPYYGGLLYK